MSSLWGWAKLYQDTAERKTYLGSRAKENTRCPDLFLKSKKHDKDGRYESRPAHARQPCVSYVLFKFFRESVSFIIVDFLKIEYF